MSRTLTWLKMLSAGAVLCIGGPMFVQSIRPTDEELFKRYNPDLQKKSLENRGRREQEFDEYVTKLKEWSKSDKSIWLAAKEYQEKKRAEAEAQPARANEEEKAQREQMRREMQEGK